MNWFLYIYVIIIDFNDRMGSIEREWHRNGIFNYTSNDNADWA